MPDYTVPAGTSIPFGPTAAGVSLAGGSYLLIGWAVENADPAIAARMVLRDGLDANGAYRVPIRLAGNESNRDTIAGMGIILESGLFVDVTAGTVQGTMFVVPMQTVERQGELLVLGLAQPGFAVPIGEIA